MRTKWMLWIPVFLGSALCCLSIVQAEEQVCAKTPLDRDRLKAELSLVRGESKAQPGWPRSVRYVDRQYDFRTDTFAEEEKTFEVKKKPIRIIAHAVGVTEILWAICPRERIVAFNDLAADPKFSFIPDEVRRRGPIFWTPETELVLGYQPDLVFTVFYSSVEFKEKLSQAKVRFFDLGYFGTMESIQYQALLIGRLIGEEGNAEALVRLIDEKIREIRERLPQTGKSPRVLYYDENGYVPGRTSNFTSICEIVGARNVGEEQGIKSWIQIDHETLLKWDPDIIVVPEESHLKNLLMTNRILSHARAVQEGRVYSMPGIYLRVDSQYMILSANELAGIVYAEMGKTSP
jgi:iron complex transport system substrate-binding protein